MGDIGALGKKSKQTLEGVNLLGVKTTFEKGTDVGIVRIVVEVRVGTDPEH